MIDHETATREVFEEIERLKISDQRSFILRTLIHTALEAQYQRGEEHGKYQTELKGETP